MKQADTGRTRLTNDTGPGGEVGQARAALYRATWSRVGDAFAAGFWLEVVTLCESMIADRLEARLAAVRGSAVRLQTLGRLAASLRAEDGDEACKALCEDIEAWARRRNAALHEMVKLSDGRQSPWEDRYSQARSAAADGMSLARKADRLTRKPNKVAAMARQGVKAGG